jgi:leader peptidase (prepilin peptidase)/N-methyltransferase
MPILFWCGFVFILGLMVGSFLNVLIARLPYEKSIVWPSSRCFNCYRPIRLTDNIPIIGYLRLRGRCRYCCASFSSRYLWVEIGTGLAFLALFVVEVLLNWFSIPALKFDPFTAAPPGKAWVIFAYHAFLLSALIAAGVIDAQHRIIPPLIPYTGVAVGIIGGALMPWPWPNPASAAGVMPPDVPWMLTEFWGKIPLGVQPWPFWGPTFKFAPPGSIQLGLLNGVIGALAGSITVRLVRWLFGTGFGREAMGMGDADLLMMAGAFLGWQVAVLALFVGAVTALVLKVAALIFGPEPVGPAAGEEPPIDARELPFGPGLALGVVVTWFAWPWLGPKVQFVFFDLVTFGLSVFILCVGLLAAGLLLRRPEEPTPVAEG